MILVISRNPNARVNHSRAAIPSSYDNIGMTAGARLPDDRALSRPGLDREGGPATSLTGAGAVSLCSGSCVSSLHTRDLTLPERKIKHARVEALS